jgi:hypothetical protein
MFESGSKFQLRPEKIKAEISGIYPAGQSVNIHDNSDNWYRLLINGYEVMLKESILNVLFEPYVPEVPKETIVGKVQKAVKAVKKVVKIKKK